MQILTTTIPRYVFATVMALFGVMHFMNGPAMAGMVPLPGGVFWVYLSGAGLIAAAASMYTGKMASLGTMLLGGMLTIFVLTIHLPSFLGGNEMALGQVLKDLGLAAGALTFSGIFKAQEETASEKVNV